MFDNKVFISHSSKNKEVADHLCAFIARIGVKEKNIFCSSVVGQGIGNGEKLNTAIANAIQDSSLLIFLLSYDFINSSYCMEELGVGWFLSQRGDVTCYYLVLPDIEMSDLIGFVNSKSDKFTFIDLEHREELSSLSCDLAKQLHIRMKTHNVITNAENVFLSSIRNTIEQIVDARKTRKHFQELQENEKSQLNDVITNTNKKVEELTIQLEQAKLRREEQDAQIELKTIERVFWSISYTQLIPKKPMPTIEKDFWFEFINRYEDLLEILGCQPSEARMEEVMAFVYLANGNPDKAYFHFLNFIKLTGRHLMTRDLESFADLYNAPMTEILSIVQDLQSNEREGMTKDHLTAVITFLTYRKFNANKNGLLMNISPSDR